MANQRERPLRRTVLGCDSVLYEAVQQVESVQFYL
jgi:hypothetical protein